MSDNTRGITGPPHTVVLTIACGATGADIDAIFAAVLGAHGVTAAEHVATYEHEAEARDVECLITVPAEHE